MLKYDYKCPVCSYVYKQPYVESEEESQRVGDEAPIAIKTRHAELVIPAEKAWDEEHVSLIGCPKCRSITFKKSWE